FSSEYRGEGLGVTWRFSPLSPVLGGEGSFGNQPTTEARMPLQICILGIDGSGKTTVASALPMILAAELGLPAASAGEEFRVCAPDEDHLAPHFEPDGLPPAARLSRHLRGLAKRFVNRRRIYPLFKLAQMAFQD